jgi:ketosteroid isomerase-like protein
LYEDESVTRNRHAEDTVRARNPLGLTHVGDGLGSIRCATQHNGAMDRIAVETWVAGYERLWRTPGTDRLNELFVPDASYLPSPWAQQIEGLDAIARFWEAERKGPDEEFTMTSDVVTVDGRIAVVRVLVRYGVGESKAWRDLWVLGFAEDARCSSFEEWPFAPDQPDGH